MTDWPTMQPRAAQIEEQLGNNPIVVWGLSRAYTDAGRPDDAIRVTLRMVREIADYELLDRLADAYWAKRDIPGWINAWEAYLATPKDIFDFHAGVCEKMATQLIQHGEPQLALKYSEIAAATGSRGGLENHAAILLALRRYDEAEQFARRLATIYRSQLSYYRFCRTSGRGDLEWARAINAPLVEQYQRSNDPNTVRNTALYFQLEDQPEKARQMWQRLSGMVKNHLTALTLAIVALEAKEPDKAISLLEEASKLTPRNIDEHTYAAGVAELLRCIPNPAAVPDRQGPVGRIVASKISPAPRGNVCYFLGRLCELRNLNDDAKWWYSAAMECPDLSISTRPLAALGLRRLGEEYYP